jgi:hypothetical protein
MVRHREAYSNSHIRLAKHHNGEAKAWFSRHGVTSSKGIRARQLDVCLPFAPPEDWHPPTGRGDYRVIVQAPGPGFRHILSESEIRERLNQLPAHFRRPLEVVQLSRMTRKKQTFPCYGMQWGNAVYLYPLEESMTEYYWTPPRPSLMNETRMYGGRWVFEPPSTWKLIWSESAIRDFYLNNILIHELGHLLDDRNTKSSDRERYAEWFAIRYGYLPSRAARAKRLAANRKVVRRHARK